MRERCSCSAEIDGADEAQIKRWRKRHVHEFGTRPESDGGFASTQTKVGTVQMGFVPGDVEA
jgi:hypothetical protein